MRVHLKGVHIVKKKLASGEIKLFYYHRKTRKRIEGIPGTPEFVASFANAERATADKHEGTFVALIRDYTNSIQFQNLAEVTKKEYKRLLTAAEAEFGDLPIEALNDPEVRQEFLSWHEKLARRIGLRQADYTIQTISSMLSWAIERGKISSNHLRGFKKSYRSNRSQIIWTNEHIDKFMAVAPIEMQRAMILALNTAQREGDLIRLTWDAYDGHIIRLKQSKTGMPVAIPCTTELKTMLDGMERKVSTILTSVKGRPFKPRNFLNMWKRSMERAGISGLHFHDLRGTAITRLAEAGCSVGEIAAISGHTIASAHKIIESYLARTPTLARQAIAKLERRNRR
jgi:integrase